MFCMVLGLIGFNLIRDRGGLEVFRVWILMCFLMIVRFLC